MTLKYHKLVVMKLCAHLHAPQQVDPNFFGYSHSVISGDFVFFSGSCRSTAAQRGNAVQHKEVPFY